MAVVNDILSNVAVDEYAIPSGIDTFTEAATYVIEGMENDFDTMMESEGILDESVVVTEAVGEKLTQFFQAAWAKIKAFFAKVAAWFKARCSQAKEAFVKLGNKISDSVADAKRKSAIKFTGKISAEIIAAANRSDDAKEITIHKWIFRDDISKEMSDAYHVVNSMGLTMKAVSGDTTEEDIEKFPASLVHSTDLISVSEMKRRFAKMLGAEDTIKRRVSSFKSNEIAEMSKYVIDDGNQKAIKSNYNQARANIKEAIKTAKDVSKNTSSGNDIADNRIKNNISLEIRLMKTAIQCMQALCSVEMDCRRQKLGEDFRVLHAIYSLGSREIAKAKAANESVEAGSIFAW